MTHLEDNDTLETPVWAIFGDLMAGLVGIFVLLLVWTLGIQLELAQTLSEEIAKREQAEQRQLALETALADPLASGRVTWHEGRIGISGSVLFSLNSAQLQPAGRELLNTLVEPLKVYLAAREELLMVSGFTDDLPIAQGNSRFQDNLELSAERALTVTRALIAEGMPATLVFTAAFGAQQPVADNNNADNRARNRRVELAAIPKNANRHSSND